MNKITTLFVSLFSIINYAQSTAVYDISVTTIWTNAEHTSVPGSAHWSDLIGATHTTANEFLSLGSIATTGIKDVAEFGANTAFTNEINAAISANRADQHLQQSFPFAAQATTTLTDVSISADFPLITLVSMVAPSPDWFIAVNSLNMRSGNNAVNNGWKDTFAMDVFVYDAGTDSGTNYTSSNQATNPFQPISMLNSAPVNGNKMATITFTYKSSTLSTSEFALNNIIVFPNPATDKITISNIENTNAERVDIYNILGSKVKTVMVEDNLQHLAVNVNNLNSGVYLLSISTTNGHTITRKLIIE